MEKSMIHELVPKSDGFGKTAIWLAKSTLAQNSVTRNLPDKYGVLTDWSKIWIFIIN